LVTGAFGFVGTAVVRRLAAAGHSVVALTQRPQGAPVPPTAAAEVVHGDVRSFGLMARLAETVDGVCHLAGLTQVRESFSRPGEYFSVNAAGTGVIVSALLCAAAQGRLVRLVQASTAAVYGHAPDSVIAESFPTAPVSPYGASKLAAEGMALSAAASGGVGVTVLRAFNVAGAVEGRGDTDLSRAIPKALAVARGLAPVFEVNGDGAAVRDYVHVDDVARAFVLALERTSAGRGAVYNVGATAASVASVIEAVSRASGAMLPVKHLPPKQEVATVLADTARIRAELSWVPECSALDRIVADAWAAGQSRYIPA
jgi:UDP-glucose 4-epimerase